MISDPLGPGRLLVAAVAEAEGRDEVVVVVGLGGTEVEVEAEARAGIVAAALAGIVAVGLGGIGVGARALAGVAGLGGTPEAGELAVCRSGVVASIGVETEAAVRVWIVAVPDAAAE